MGKPRHLMTPDERARADAYQKAYREKHAERLKAYKEQPEVKAMRKAYRDRPEVKAKNRANKDAWVQANRERVREKERLRYEKDLEKGRAKCKSWRESNREKCIAASKAWQRANPEIVRQLKRVASAKRRARERMAQGAYTRSDIATLLRLQRRKCAICKVSLDLAYQVDHVVPLALGGSNERSNLQLLCPFCNQSKGAKDPLDFMQSKGFLL